MKNIEIIDISMAKLKEQFPDAFHTWIDDMIPECEPYEYATSMREYEPETGEGWRFELVRSLEWTCRNEIVAFEYQTIAIRANFCDYAGSPMPMIWFTQQFSTLGDKWHFLEESSEKADVMSMLNSEWNKEATT
jgi:hypothetical protein